MIKIIFSICVWILLAVSISYSMNLDSQVDEKLEKFYEKLDTYVPELEKRVERLELILDRIERIKLKRMNVSDSSFDILYIIKIDIDERINYYKAEIKKQKEIMSIDLLLGNIEDEKFTFYNLGNSFICKMPKGVKNPGGINLFKIEGDGTYTLVIGSGGSHIDIVDVSELHSHTLSTGTYRIEMTCGEGEKKESTFFFNRINNSLKIITIEE